MPSAVTRPHCDACEIAARATGFRDAGVGAGVGAAVGAGVGAAVGAGVGAAVGAGVGDAVGAGVEGVGVEGVGVEGVGTSFMASLSREPGWSAAEVAALSLRVNQS